MPEPTSVSHLWNMYRKGLEKLPVSRHEQKLTREAFYVGAVSICTVLQHLERRGDAERMTKTIARTDVTQQIYLNMPSRFEEMRERWKAAMAAARPPS